jgi:hypothetical protein
LYRVSNLGEVDADITWNPWDLHQVNEITIRMYDTLTTPPVRSGASGARLLTWCASTKNKMMWSVLGRGD